MGISYDAAVSLLGIYPKNMKISTQTITCYTMPTTVLFTIVRIGIN